MQGIIEKIDDIEKTEKFKVVTISGKKYGTKLSLLSGFQVGDEVEYESVTQGQYENLKTLAKAGVALDESMEVKCRMEVLQTEDKNVELLSFMITMPKQALIEKLNRS
jgi:hypothetical protein